MEPSVDRWKECKRALSLDLPIGDAIHNGLGGNVQIDHQVNVQCLVQSGGLLERSRKSIQQQGFALIDKPMRVFHNQTDHNLVRYQLAFVHVLLGLISNLGSLSDVMSQNIPRRHMVKIRHILEDLARYGALATAGFAQDEEEVSIVRVFYAVAVIGTFNFEAGERSHDESPGATAGRWAKDGAAGSCVACGCPGECGEHLAAYVCCDMALLSSDKEQVVLPPLKLTPVGRVGTKISEEVRCTFRKVAPRSNC